MKGSYYLSFSLTLFILLAVAIFLKGRIRGVINNKYFAAGKERLILGELPPGEATCQLTDKNCTEKRLDALAAALTSPVGKDKVVLPPVCEKKRETIATIDIFQRMELDQVMQPILGTVMQSANGAYRFKVIEYEGLTVYTDDVGNRNLIFNCYVYEMLQQFMIRLKVDVIKYIDVKEKHRRQAGKGGCADVTTPEFPVFEIGMPSRDQLLPFPTQIINTGGGGGADVLSAKGYNPVLLTPVLGLHVNSLEQFNSNMVLSYAGAKRLADLGGTTDNTNEFNGYKGDWQGPIQDKAVEYNKWPVLDEMPKDEGQWPCKSESLDWGRDGVPIAGLRQRIGSAMTAVTDYSDDKYTKSCPGTRSSAMHIPRRPNYWPTLGGLPRNSGENYWLFDRMSGIPSFISGSTRG